jgi:hypothetical protein
MHSIAKIALIPLRNQGPHYPCQMKKNMPFWELHSTKCALIANHRPKSEIRSLVSEGGDGTTYALNGCNNADAGL